MASEPHKTVSDFDTAETFRMTLSFGNVLLRLLPLFVLLFVFLTFLFTAIGYIADLSDTATWVIAAVCAAPLSLLMPWLKKLQFDAQVAATNLTISPEGLTLEEPNLTTKLAWHKARKIGYASMRDPLRTHMTLLATIVVAIGSLAARRRESAIIGAGRLIIAKDAPQALRTHIQQNERKLPVDQKTGRRQQAILLQHFDRDWKNGRIGDWVRAYRPDLLG